MILALPIKLNKSILYKYLFYKHFYRFIFLHKPLCSRYKDFTLQIFGLYICRSCFFLYLGFFISLILTLIAIKDVTFNKYFFLGFAGMLLTFFISYPPIYARFSRITKDFIRFYDGIFLAAFFIICFKLGLFIGITSICAFFIMKHIYNKKRSGKNICKGCDKLQTNKTCEGYVKQQEALLKIEEEYSNIIMEWVNKGRIKYD